MVTFRSLALFLMFTVSLQATPTSLFWTNCNTDINPTGTGQFQINNFFTVYTRRGQGAVLNPDVGILVGLPTWKNVTAEMGIDHLGGADDPIYFNGKFGMDEDKLFKGSPAWNIGLFDVGTRTKTAGRTNQNVVDVILGKSLPKYLGGRLFVGGYSGSSALKGTRRGWMVGYQRTFCHSKDCYGVEYDRWVVSADWASGKNLIGGGGFALTCNFTPNIGLQTGPVFFNSKKVNGNWKWGFQLVINFPIWPDDWSKRAKQRESWNDYCADWCKRLAG